MTPLEDFSQTREITQERAERATEWLVVHAQEYGQAKAEKDRKEHLIKVAKAKQTIRSKQSSVALREAEAIASPEYLQALDESAEAAATYAILEATRIAAGAVIDMWRSLNAANRGVKV